MKISIVVAAYNVEKYISRCLYSILNQSYKNVEVIIVNDCSTDKTKHICSEFGKNDERIRLINKDINEGLSAARNTGIDAATGDYITFIDGDDFIELDTIEYCAEIINKRNPDEIVFGSCFDRKNGKSYKMEMIHSLNYYGKKDMECYFKEALGSLPNEINDRNIGITPWGRVYKKTIFDRHELKFISERIYIYEDLTFFLLSTPYINSVVIIDKQFYHYCENEGSLTQKTDLSRYNKVKTMYTYIKSNYQYEIFNDSETLLRFKRLMLSYIRLSVMQVGKCINNIYLIKQICNDKFTSEILKDYPIKELPLKQRIFTLLLSHKHSLILFYICKFYS